MEGQANKKEDPKITHRATTPKLLRPFKFLVAPLLLLFDVLPVGSPTGPVSVVLFAATEEAELYALFAAFWSEFGLINGRSMIWITPFSTNTSGWRTNAVMLPEVTNCPEEFEVKWRFSPAAET